MAEELDHVAAYRDLRERVRDFVGAALARDPAALDALTEPCPQWRAHDVLAHLVGVTADVVAGRIEGVATDPWTARQVNERCDRTVEEMLVEWEQHGPGFEEFLAGFPPEITGQAVFDAMTHEQDLRHALGVPGARESDAVAIAFGWIVGASGGRRSAALRFETEHGEFVSGEGDPAATVRAPRFELVRAITGRRSVAQVEAYEWDPAARPDLLIVKPPFSYRADPLVE